MWWVGDDGSTNRIITELEESKDLGMPTIVGEFAPMGVGCSQYIDVLTILEECRKQEIGFFPWSWGMVTNLDCEYQSMSHDGVYGNWKESPRHGEWGKIVSVTEPNSIANQAVEPLSFTLVQ
jgi:mannan endo-1,4-beta-mannosidase